VLGGIYKLTAAPQGAAGSASDVMPIAKKQIHMNDLLRTLSRFGVPLNWPAAHPRKSLHAQRLLHAVSDDDRPHLTHALYRAYWRENVDISDLSVLSEIVSKTGINLIHPLETIITQGDKCTCCCYCIIEMLNLFL
jgi:2-hydroxychromene-2-carboxylate isomerase